MSKKLLGTTQDAVIGATDGVETVIQETAGEHGYEPFYLSGEFWVAMAFVLVVVGLFVPLKRAFSAFLDKYIQKEAARIDDAENLKDEARKVLANYEQKLENMAAETKSIIAAAEKSVEQLEKKELQNLDNRLRSQEKIVKEKVSAELAFAEKELSSVVIDKSINILEQSLSRKMNEDARNKLIDESIERISNLS